MKRTWRPASVLVWIGFAMAPLILGDWELAMFGQTLVYGIVATSLAFIWGQAGLLCFGQSVFFGTGAYLTGLAAKGMLLGLPELGWTAIPLSFLAGMVLSGLLGGGAVFWASDPERLFRHRYHCFGNHRRARRRQLELYWWL